MRRSLRHCDGSAALVRHTTVLPAAPSPRQPGVRWPSGIFHHGWGTIHRSILREAGIPEDRIAVSDDCTHEDRGRFFSPRRDAGATGRQGVVVGWRD